jgi:hypothetical protein
MLRNKLPALFNASVSEQIILQKKSSEPFHEDPVVKIRLWKHRCGNVQSGVVYTVHSKNICLILYWIIK